MATVAAAAAASPSACAPRAVSKTCPLQIDMLCVPHLRDVVPAADAALPNRRPSGSPFSTYIGDGDVVLGTIVHPNLMDGAVDASAAAAEGAAAVEQKSPTAIAAAAAAAAAAAPVRVVSYLRAGPRHSIYHDPAASRAAIVTCGGLCPGMNDVIAAVTHTLHTTYGVRDVMGVRSGFHGFYKPDLQPPMRLTPDSVRGMQHAAGTMLGSARGGFDPEKILTALQAWGCNLVFIIGGDGTHRGAQALADFCRERGLPISVTGVPKTIDNDLGMIDRSFGFESAVEEAVHAIKSAKTEARCAPNGIGIVKLMGRDSGFIAAHATISAGDVDLLLIPELPLNLDPASASNVFLHLERVLEKRGHAVVVLSEGAGADHLLKEKRLAQTDAHGNQPKLPPIGVYMKSKIAQWFEDKGEKEVTVKYIDPSYIVSLVVVCCLLGGGGGGVGQLARVGIFVWFL
jgi:6-phosphofructokinase 1